MLTASTSEAYSLLFKLLCDPGDTVLAPRPSYPLVEHLTDLDGVIARALTASSFTADGRSTSRDLRRACGAARRAMRAIVLISPNNPTGSVVTAAELDAIAALAREHDVALIADEVFADYPIRNSQRASVLSPADGADLRARRTVEIRRLAAGEAGVDRRERPAALVDEALERLETICDAYLSVSTPVQVAAPDLLRERRGRARADSGARPRQRRAAATLAAATSAVLGVSRRGRLVCCGAGSGDRSPRKHSWSICWSAPACSCILDISSTSTGKRSS